MSTKLVPRAIGKLSPYQKAQKGAEGFRDRLVIAMRQRGYDRGEATRLAAVTGLSKQVLSKYISGHAKRPEAAALVALADALKVSGRWLLLGDVPMAREKSLEADESYLIELYGKLTPENREHWVAIGRTFLKTQSKSQA